MTIGPHVSNADASRLYERFRLHVSVEENVCAFFERDFLERRNWHAAAISEELTTAEAERLAIVCRRRNYRKAWALDINRLDTDFFFEIILDFKSLSMLEETFVTPSYLVVEEEERFMLVSDSDHYWEIAGPQAFLEDVLQKPLETVGREFMETTRNYRQGSSRIGGFLIRIADEATERSTPST